MLLVSVNATIIKLLALCSGCNAFLLVLRYIPLSMRDKEENEAWWKKLHDVTSKIKELLVLDGSVMIGYTPMSQKKLGNFFRMVVSCQPPPTYAGMDFVIEQIEKFGAPL